MTSELMYEYMKEMYRKYLLNRDVSFIRIKRMAQSAYCEKYNVPHFAPIKGTCWSCKKQIYDKMDFIKAASSLVTGCPHCNRSYCD